MRLFVAAWPDDATRRRLAALQLELGRSKGLSFVGPTRWHVTLRFLGEVAEEQVEPLANAVIASGTGLDGPAVCRLGPGTAWFTGVRVLHLPAAGLDGVAEAVRRATAPFVPETEGGDPPFNGHLTLARAKGRRLSVAALGEMAGLPFEASFAVPSIDLVASASSPEGHVYTTVARAPLGGAGAGSDEG
ncbi:MAG TPA: RNA 2',3'-cyclic phosphodiesterase [Acidimicrobiales bacterium]|nr:RNA 2',3'-cyclic phosphodiesterase [Acidimicrobiales bacterium]